MTERATMNKKPVFDLPAKSIINFKSGFGPKLLCDDLTFTTGTACAYTCSFCYVPDAMRKQRPYWEKHGITGAHEDIVIRRSGALDRLKAELTDRHGRPKFRDLDDRRVIYSSPLVDVAANMELVRETIEACCLIMDLTHWRIRLLSKSNLLPKIAQGLEARYCPSHVRDRMIFGVSTGTLDDKLATAFEQDTPLPSKRIKSLHWLQDNHFRTFGMICPSLPQKDYKQFAREMCAAIRADRCEHVWAEVINVRGDSMTRTCDALIAAGYTKEAEDLRLVSEDKEAWEQYSRETFLAHIPFYRQGKLRFLQYVNNSNREWWTYHVQHGAVLLGQH